LHERAMIDLLPIDLCSIEVKNLKKGSHCKQKHRFGTKSA
jgi:hypothetical protein